MKHFWFSRQAFSLLARRGLWVSLIINSLTLALQYAQRKAAQREAFAQEISQVQLLPPTSVPPIGQASIDLAMAMFSIAVPASAEWPHFDGFLKDRGLTTRGTFIGKATVAIGPAAFRSWSLLGSTLAHELEVHCQQSFLFISLMDALQLDGTSEAERQAYLHELRHAKRFGLETEDADLIAATMEYYYPESASVATNTPFVSVQRWLARNFLIAKAIP